MKIARGESGVGYFKKKISKKFFVMGFSKTKIFSNFNFFAARRYTILNKKLWHERIPLNKYNKTEISLRFIPSAC